jgi:hypothetical protein
LKECPLPRVETELVPATNSCTSETDAGWAKVDAWKETLLAQLRCTPAA